MAKRGYKLQEFVAHSSNVNCLNIGKKTCRMYITGGDDYKVNLWAIGKPTSLMSLCGHTSPVESLAFDTAEVLVLGGASTGVIKLWDLEEAKMVRTLTGHRSNCTAIEFHPFGEFFASGSADTNLKLWDIRKKGTLHTYKGHTRGISTIRFTPDGRWVVSGGLDNVVKVWDLTAGKLLHDFKFHEGHIRSLDFHPLEFLLATGSADRTVKFWDLETFELIGSARPEATGVRAISFHPDGRTLFCGLDDSLKVYSWEPVICHDSVDIGWSTLGDLCIHEEKLLGCSYYRNSVAVWVADVSLIEPYGVGFIPEESDCIEKKFSIPKSDSPDKVRSGMRSTSHLRSLSPDYESKEIKNIYVDSADGKPVSSQKVGSLTSPKRVLPLDSKEMSNPPSDKKIPVTGGNAKADGEAFNKSFVVPTVVPRDNPIEKNSSNSGRETVTFSRTRPGMLLRPAHMQRLSNSKNDVEKLSVALESETFSNMPSEKVSAMDLKLQSLNVLEEGVQKSYEEKSSDFKNVAEKFEKDLSPEKPSSQEHLIDSIVSGDESVNNNRAIPSVKIINGVAVVAGRTRSLVERFERREKFSNEDQSTSMESQTAGLTNSTPTMSTNVTPLSLPEAETDRTPIAATNMTRRVISERNRSPIATTDMTPEAISERGRSPSTATNMTCHVVHEMDRRTLPAMKEEPQISGRDSNSSNYRDVSEELMQAHDVFLSTIKSRLTKLQVVRHFWERNDIKGAINALRKLPDHSVQADIISVLMEKMEILTLDLFSCLLPVLVGLLDSKMERHTGVSLEMLLKLVAVFGPVIRSTISGPPLVGVNLHAEQRLECCKQCFVQLQKIQQILPALIRKGGVLAKSAVELNLVLQES
eukprot:XP_015576203.1 katanin p80 WD40 repeat-containing subunit B1 homolog isoform X3 [Ricinus communis]